MSRAQARVSMSRAWLGLGSWYFGGSRLSAAPRTRWQPPRVSVGLNNKCALPRWNIAPLEHCPLLRDYLVWTYYSCIGGWRLRHYLVSIVPSPVSQLTRTLARSNSRLKLIPSGLAVAFANGRPNPAS